MTIIINPNIPLFDGAVLRWNEDEGWFDPIPFSDFGNVRVQSSGADGGVMVQGKSGHLVAGTSKTPASLSRVPMYAHALVSAIPANSTLYTAPFFVSVPGSIEYTMPILRPGTIKNFYMRQVGSQPGTGSLECHIRLNQASDELTIVIPPNEAGGVTRVNSLDSFLVVAGSLIGFKFVNNANAPSAKIGFLGFDVEYD